MSRRGGRVGGDVEDMLTVGKELSSDSGLESQRPKTVLTRFLQVSHSVQLHMAEHLLVEVKHLTEGSRKSSAGAQFLNVGTGYALNH